jgi:hypothetical protein
MPEHHEPVEVIVGETWEIPSTLLDANGSAIDLTGAALEWVPVNSGGNPSPSRRKSPSPTLRVVRSASISPKRTRLGWTPDSIRTGCERGSPYWRPCLKWDDGIMTHFVEHEMRREIATGIATELFSARRHNEGHPGHGTLEISNEIGRMSI